MVSLQSNKNWNLDMEQQAEICETYQLKWTSFGTYMNSCISTSLYNESFADVALVTTDGHQMMAHRYVLSYSSLFLAQVLKLQRKVTTALPLMIVMPPEIDFKSLKVLVRYMYSGEAKVSKEILKKVLRGGDILQIKGLYREKEDAEKIVRITQQTPTSQQSPSLNVSPSPMLVPSTPPPSPAIVPPPLAPLQKQTSKPLQNQQPQQKQTIQQTAQHTIIQQKQLTGSQPTNTQQVGFKPPNRKIIVVKKSQPAKPKNEVLNFTVLQNFDKSEQQNKAAAYKRNNDKETSDKPETSMKESIQYLMIKDEPVDWCEEDMEEMEEKEIYDEVTIKAEEVYNSEDVSEEEEEDTEKGDKMFSPLTCELCSATFTLPGEWVKHVQTHTDMLPAKRRRRDSTGDSYVNDSFPELTCDLCQKPFPTPAEWVKHIQNAHTEFELHLSNKKNSKEKPKGRGSPRTILPHPRSEPSEDSNAKTCSVCSKTFPSQASMLIHKRSHTGERPFQCNLCRKSFAVKSNLLRHLRTIHNMIINATDVDGREHDEEEEEEETREEIST